MAKKKFLVVKKLHCKKAIELIKQEGIEVNLYGNMSSLKSSCDIRNSAIHIGTKDIPSLVLCSLSHEMGHILSKRKRFRKGMRFFRLWRWGLQLSGVQKKAIIEEERRAWKLGFAFLRKHNLPTINYMRYVRDTLLAANIKSLNKSTA